MGQTATDSSSQITRNNTLSPVWMVEITPAAGCIDRLANEIAADAAELQLAEMLNIQTARGFLLQGDFVCEQVVAIAKKLFAEPVVESIRVYLVSDGADNTAGFMPSDEPATVHVFPKPGVTDSQAGTALRELRALGYAIEGLRTCRKYFIQGLADKALRQLATRLLSNDAIEQVVYGRLHIQTLQHQGTSQFQLVRIPLRSAENSELERISREGGLSLTLIEMQTIRDHFVELKRDPTDIELETVAQTWSEHCSHKTLAGRIAYRDEQGVRIFDNMLRETIFAATQTIRTELGDDDWCVSVFRDNAGIVDFDGDNCLTFKVETHNRPSAIEPYGGANTGIGGVIRDTLGTGLGARPICNTDVFCFAEPTSSMESLPPGVLHPRRIMKSVVAGVRDYGNRMGIPTVNGAVYFDSRYVGNPLVFCGSVGLLPRQYAFKQPQAGDYIVTIGGRTGRDGIHGATFSSAELTEHSEVTSGGAVQIGNAITEKMVLDVLLQARDRGLFTAVTDCGAGGFSSAVGEMGETIGAVVWLDRAPLKYDGLSYTEVWISEAQERMVFAVPHDKWDEFNALCESESVEATIIGQFEATGHLHLMFNDETVGTVAMSFLHDGRPKVVRNAVWNAGPLSTSKPDTTNVKKIDLNKSLQRILSSGNVASKHWIIRQYDHEVLAGSVIKPLVGVLNDGPSDAAVIRPVLTSNRGAAISCGMNPYFGDIDPWHMATSSIDEAVRNCVAVGANPSRIAILDNFCWGYTDRPETLGSLVRAALACQELAIQLKTPFISGKDSLNNEFSYTDDAGNRQTISIPSTLLISALGQVDDITKCVTMDLKSAGNSLFLVGLTHNELGGSHFHLVNSLAGGEVPKVDGPLASRTFYQMHRAINLRLVRACHDLSEGGLATAVAEMAFAGGFGAEIDLAKVVVVGQSNDRTPEQLRHIRLFSESNTRFICEVTPENRAAFVECLEGISIAEIGKVTNNEVFRCFDSSGDAIKATNAELKHAWQSPLDWT